MKKRFLYTAIFGMLLAACSDEELVRQPSTPDNNVEVQFPENAQVGELLIKFKPEMSDILDQTIARAAKTRSAMTRSGIPSTDEILDILGAYQFERVFPEDKRNEARTREAELHLWYRVKFDENTDLQEAARRLRRLGEVSAVQCNHRIQRAYRTDKKRTYVSKTLQRASRPEDNVDFSELGLPFTADPGLKHQWHYYNTGDYSFNNQNSNNAAAVAGCDVNVVEAWKLCTGDPSIIVAVLDEGVMTTHPDLEGNIWNNDDEGDSMNEDADGNGYKGDKHGYNFVTNSAQISWWDESDTGHGTHVAGTIAAANGNGEGVSGIAGGNGNADSGVKIMSCQVFSGESGATLDAEARAIKYAADNGAVILQCSWGFLSADADILEFGQVLGPATEEEWVATYPLEKDALDYFIQNAGSPNGVIEGGIAVFASGNEYAKSPSYPGAYSKCVTVSALDAGYLPSSYTNYGKGIDLSAPGGDSEFYGKVGEDDNEYWSESADVPGSGSILSTIVERGQAAYGYLDGTSMACPHVAGVAALGLSYAKEQRRHFKASEFIKLMKESVKEVDFSGKKVYYKNHTSPSAPATEMTLGNYVGKMGTGLIDAAKLLHNIEGSGSDMKLPNMYVSEGKTVQLDMAYYFVDGENLTYTCAIDNESVATLSVSDTMLTINGLKTGSANIAVKTSNGEEQTIVVTVRKGANDNGWM